MVLQNCTKRTADIRRKEVVGEFKNIGFDIEIDANLKMVNSLDITLDLYSDSYKPYKKPNDRLQYVHISSNHPVNIFKQLPLSITNNRLSKNSSNETIFEQEKVKYEEALRFNNVNLKNQKPIRRRHPEI